MTDLIGQRPWIRSIQVCALVAGVTLGAGRLYAAGTPVRASLKLAPTSAAPNARGMAHLMIQSSKRGKFTLVAAHLQGGKQYDVIVSGVKVGVMHTSRGGSGKASFSTNPGTKTALLGFDPSGGSVMVRDEDDGEDVLVGDVPDDGAGEVACCLADHEGEVECEHKTAVDCTAAGGTVGMSAGTVATSCLPDPCAATTPPGGTIVCCTNETHDDESAAECEAVSTEAQCVANGGMVVQAASCDPNPCQGTPPVNPGACCLMHSEDGESEVECKTISADACAAAGGTIPAGAASCAADPCASQGGDGGNQGDSGDDDNQGSSGGDGDSGGGGGSKSHHGSGGGND
jgi:uncharacterized membrane protein YgcG